MTRFIALLLFAFSSIVVSSAVDGQEKKPADKTPGNKATPGDYARLASLRKYTGKVSVGPKSVIIKVDDAAYKAALKAAMAVPAPQQKLAIAKVEQMFAPQKWALGKEFELEFAEKVALRKLNKAFEFDVNTGFPKKDNALPPGTGGMPGYPAKIEDFSSDAVSTVTFGTMRNGKPTVAMIVVDNKP